MIPPDKLAQIRASVDKWLEEAKSSELIRVKQKADPHRSQGASGISVDWLKQFSDSLREGVQLLPSETYAVVKEVITFVTQEQTCTLVDIIDKEHVGAPSCYICHSWNGSFFAMVDLLVADFNKRWQAHLAFRVGKGREWRFQDAEADEETAALAVERKKLCGYYVWLDIAAINQHHRDAFDPAFVGRLVTVIGRTVLILDEDAKVLSRLWCCFELWTAIKHAKAVFTLRLPSYAAAVSGNAVGDDSDDEAHAKDPEDVAEELPVLDLAAARASVPHDRAAIMGSLNLDLASSKIKAKTLEDVAREVRAALVGATIREFQKPDLLERVYMSLAQCSKVYADVEVQPGYQEVETVRKALREVIGEHYRKEAAKCRMISKEDPELEVWESMCFLEKRFKQHWEEDFWVQEMRRLSKLTLHSYASRFSNSYVNSLMRQAGTCDDMKLLAQYVHSQCRTRSGDR